MSKNGKFKILADAPVKDQNETDLIDRKSTKTMKEMKRNSKNGLKKIKKKDRNVVSLTEIIQTGMQISGKMKPKSVDRKILESELSDMSKSSENVSLHDSSYGEQSLSEIEDFSNSEMNCKYFYVAQVEDKFETKLLVNFFKKNGNSLCFLEVPDKSLVSLDDIILKLPQPSISGGTMRDIIMVVFHQFDFAKYNMR